MRQQRRYLGQRLLPPQFRMSFLQLPAQALDLAAQLTVGVFERSRRLREGTKGTQQKALVFLLILIFFLIFFLILIFLLILTFIFIFVVFGIAADPLLWICD